MVDKTEYIERDGLHFPKTQSVRPDNCKYWRFGHAYMGDDGANGDCRLVTPAVRDICCSEVCYQKAKCRFSPFVRIMLRILSAYRIKRVALWYWSKTLRPTQHQKARIQRLKKNA